VFKLLRYLQGMLSMILIKFCKDMSNPLNDIAFYYKIQNGCSQIWHRPSDHRSDEGFLCGSRRVQFCAAQSKDGSDI